MTLEPGDRVFLTAGGGQGLHPPVGTNGTVRKVAVVSFIDSAGSVTVDWDTDDRARSTVTPFNGRLAPAGS